MLITFPELAISLATQIAEAGGDASEFLQSILGLCPEATKFGADGSADALFMTLTGQSAENSTLAKRSFHLHVPKVHLPSTSHHSSQEHHESSPGHSNHNSEHHHDGPGEHQTGQHSQPGHSPAHNGHHDGKHNGKHGKKPKPKHKHNSNDAACNANSAGKSKHHGGSRIHGRMVDNSKIPNVDQTNTLIGNLERYGDENNGKPAKDSIDAAREMLHNTGPYKDSCIFYINEKTAGNMRNGITANNWADISQWPDKMVTIGTSGEAGGPFEGYDKFPWDKKYLPFSQMMCLPEKESKKVMHNWFRATSYAFAELCEGTAYVIYEGNWRTSKGSNGEPSIFRTDEVQAMVRKGKVTEIVQLGGKNAQVFEGPAKSDLEGYKRLRTCSEYRQEAQDIGGCVIYKNGHLLKWGKEGQEHGNDPQKQTSAPKHRGSTARRHSRTNPPHQDHQQTRQCSGQCRGAHDPQREGSGRGGAQGHNGKQGKQGGRGNREGGQ